MFSHLAAMCISMIAAICLVAFRLPFGGGYCPAKWYPFLEATCNIANEIMNNNNWDEQSLVSPFMKLVPELRLPSTTIPFIVAHRADVIIETEAYGKADVFIDDIIPVGL